MKPINLLIIMGILASVLSGCKSSKVAGNDSQEPTQPVVERTMPQGRLIGVEYRYGGMMMEMVSNFNLSRREEPARLSFYFYNQEVSYEVSDTLFDAARRIIEEEKMYAYAPDYSLELNEMILDGFHWSFTAAFEDERIHSSGSHVWPEGKGLNRLSTLLRDAAMDCLRKSGRLDEGR